MIKRILALLTNIGRLSQPPEKVKPTVDARLAVIEADILDILTTLESYKNKIMRKLQIRSQEAEEPQPLNTATLKNVNIKRVYGKGKG